MAPVLTLALAALLLAPALWRTASRPWAAACLAVLALALALLALPPLAPAAWGLSWNWSSALLLLAASGWCLWALQRPGLLGRAELGLCWRQRPGSLPLALGVAATALGGNAALLHVPGLAPRPSPTLGGTETWLYQGTLPGLVEELLFRGLLLALAERTRRGRWRLAGVELGWGACVVTIVFVLLHGPAPASMLNAAVIGALLLWLRLWTGSLVLPVCVHNAWNLIVLAAA